MKVQGSFLYSKENLVYLKRIQIFKLLHVAITIILSFTWMEFASANVFSERNSKTSFGWEKIKTLNYPSCEYHNSLHRNHNKKDFLNESKPRDQMITISLTYAEQSVPFCVKVMDWSSTYPSLKWIEPVTIKFWTSTDVKV